MLNWVVWAAGGLVMFSTAWVSAVTLFSVCLSLGFVCARSFFFFSQVWLLPSCPSAGGTGLGAAGMRALQWDVIVNFDKFSLPGKADDRRKSNSVLFLGFFGGYFTLQMHYSASWVTSLNRNWNWKQFKIASALCSSSLAGFRRSLAVVLQERKKQAQC